MLAFKYMYNAKGQTYPRRMTDLPKAEVETASTALWPRVQC